MSWKKTRMLIWGKTYPEFSAKYYETVCTGAVHADSGRLIRIYPVTLRHLDTKFKTYQWIDAEIERNTSDPRPESFKIRQDTISVGEHLTTEKKDGWEQRARRILRPESLFRSVEALQKAEAHDGTSLGLIRPKVIHRFRARTRSLEEKAEWDRKREVAIAQKDLFVDAESAVQELEFRWAEYRVEFSCEDPDCRIVHDFSIRDWGVYVLDRKQEGKKGGYLAAEADVLAHLRKVTDPAKRDVYLYLGNTMQHPRNFMVVGLFYPPKGNQGLLL
jgi:hypothetical protein